MCKTMKYLAIILLAAPVFAFACGDRGTSQLGNFAPSTSHSLVQHNTGQEIVIDASFIDKLITNPSQALFNENRYELYYLVSRGNKKALFAGLRSLAYILENPTHIIECDHKVEIYKKDEIAHTLSRSEDFHEVACELSPHERELVFSYYKSNKHLYQLIYDAPWEFSLCESIN